MADPTEPMYGVTDKLCEDLGPRTHELIDPVSLKVKRFKCEAGVELKCPRWAAVKFAEIDSFEVIDPEGNPFKVAVPETAELRKLAADEVVARLVELTSEALLARCQAHPGHGMNKASKKEAMITFLMRQRAQALPAKPAANGEEELETELELVDA